MATKPPKIFTSYNRADRDWAQWIAGVIEWLDTIPLSKRGIFAQEKILCCECSRI